MRKLLIAVCLSALAVTQVYANDVSKSGKPLTDQQQKMKDCNAEAKTQALKGDARKTFMKGCLSKEGAPAAAAAPSGAMPASAAAAPTAAGAAAADKPAADKKTSQKEKMKSCNADAKSKALKGDERKKFMSECLKG